MYSTYVDTLQPVNSSNNSVMDSEHISLNTTLGNDGF